MTKKIILMAVIVALLIAVWLGTTVYFTIIAVTDSNDSSSAKTARIDALAAALGQPDGAPEEPDIPYHLPGGQAEILTFSTVLEGRILNVTCGVSANPPALPNAEGPYEIAIFTTRPKRWNNVDWATSVLQNLSIFAKTTPINPGDTFSLDGLTTLSPSANTLLFVRYKTINLNGNPGNILLGIAVTQQELAFAKTHGTADLLQKLKDNGIFPVSYLNRNSLVDPTAPLASPYEGRINRQKLDLNTPAAVVKPQPRLNNQSRSGASSGRSSRNNTKQPQPDPDEDEE